MLNNVILHEKIDKNQAQDLVTFSIIKVTKMHVQDQNY